MLSLKVLMISSNDQTENSSKYDVHAA